jgi:hypothetical protein
LLSNVELFLEHVISGLLSLVWIFAIVFSIQDFDWAVVSTLFEYSGLIAVLISAVSYPLGIFVDTFADCILEKIRKKTKKNPTKFNPIEIIKLLEDENIRGYYTYNRFKLRVARTSVFNFALIGISGAIFICANNDLLEISNPTKSSLIFLFVFVFMALVAFCSWKIVNETIDKRTLKLNQFYESHI